MSGNIPPFPPTRLYGVHRAALPLPLWMWKESLKACIFLEVEGKRTPQDNQCPGLDSNSCRLTPGLCPSISGFSFRCQNTFAARCTVSVAELRQVISPQF